MSGPAPSSEARGFGAWLRSLPRWKKVLLVVALLLVVAGVAMLFVETGAPPPAQGGGGGGGAQTSLLPGQPAPSQLPGTAASEPASAGFFRLGFSFFAGFCIGFAVRKTLKLSAVFAGLLLLFLFLLAYAGLITVHWDAFDAMFQNLSQRVQRESENLRTFITGSLPAAGLAATGLVAGFKKN
jgi:uncharacterized membrane protein (Fun14 family)